MPRYRVSFYTTGDNFEFTYEAANADDCLDRACIHASLMFGDSDVLDEIVVRPDEGLEFLDGSDKRIELYWTTPGFHERQRAKIAAIPDAELAAGVDILRASGKDLATSPLATEYRRRHRAS